MVVSTNSDIDEETYLAAFLAYWLSGTAFVDSSAAVRPEAFLLAMKWPEGSDVAWLSQIGRGSINLWGNKGRIETGL